MDDPSVRREHEPLHGAHRSAAWCCGHESVEAVLDGVDAVDFRPGLMEQHAQLGGSPDWVPGRLTAALAEERSTVLEEHGITLDLWQCLEYRHLPLDGDQRGCSTSARRCRGRTRAAASRTRSTPTPRQASTGTGRRGSVRWRTV
ncbi:hypothetical protein [Streptomyces anulatus]|uniref:hypothetical protein n=1 Tax=Streptomyces anulatus TaxID=1892 RepID=UPI002256C038|nr:hypothetical protein [Streptomyces anulatus]MCX4502216.1 hypothetical protein [Streptomyces anulatus]